MGFFAEGDVRVERRGKSGAPSERLLHELGCAACPLNHAQIHSPKMEPTGSAAPDIYIIGEAPGKTEDEKGEQFVGDSGTFLRAKIPRDMRDKILWDNVLNCRPPSNRTPEPIEISCCHPRHVVTVVAAKPKAIFGFGNVPLSWAVGKAGIANWRGRRVPVRIGTHTAWYFPMHHPAFLLRQKDSSDPNAKEDERMFGIDLRRAFAALDHLPEPHVHTPEEARAGVKIVTECDHADAERVIAFLRRAAREEVVGLDYETTGGLRPYRDGTNIISVAIATADTAFAFPLFHKAARWSDADLEDVLTAFLSFITEQGPRKAVHNLAFELEWTGVKFGREFIRASRWDDTMSQAFILDQRMGGKGGNDEDDGVMECFGLGFLTLLHFGIDIKSLSRVNKNKLEDEPLDVMLTYNAIDAKYHRLLCLAQDELLTEEKLTHVYELHLKRIPTVVLTQIKGVPLDFDVAEALHVKYTAKIKQLVADIEKMPIAHTFFQRTGQKFNPTSNADVAVMCRDVLKSRAGERTKRKGSISVKSYAVDEKVLEQIAHPLMKLILELRGVSKLDSTYVFLPSSPIVYADGLLHPLLNTVRARTARLTSSDPNEQNLPKRDKEAKGIRRQIKAPKRMLFVSLDQGQIEARGFAMVSKDPVFTKALWENFDVHAYWAKRLASAYPSVIGGKKFLNDATVLKTFREKVKGSWVFALFFGAQLSTAAKQVEIPEEYLKREYDVFWQEFAGVRAWQDRNAEFYREHGYVECLTGRRRGGPLSTNKVINTPIQTLAAEIVMDAMNRISEINDWDLQPILNIHDDLTFVLPEDQIDDMCQKIVPEMIMPNAPGFDFINVPLVAEMSVGENLFDMENVAKFSSVDWYGKAAHAV